MTGFFGRAADFLEFGGADDEVMCAHHGDLCGMGTRRLPDLYLLVREARLKVGKSVAPLDEHRVMTPAERAEWRRELAVSLAEAEAAVAAEEAAIREGRA